MEASPAQVIELFRPETWEGEVANTVRELVPLPAIKYLKRFPGEGMFHDTLDYLVDAYDAAGDFFSEEKCAELMERVLGSYESFRCYHGCRPLSFDSYFRDGLLPLTPERLAAIAFDLFEGTVPRAEIDSLSRRANLNTRLGHVYFMADREQIIRRCGHYLIYGAEALCCLWRDEHDRATPRFRESQERHRSRGVPTIFTCDVPVAWIPAEGRRDLAHTLVTQYFQLQSYRPLALKDWNRNWGYSIRRSLPSTQFRGHIHPEIVVDPLRSSTPYRNSHLRCPWCAPSADLDGTPTQTIAER